MSRFLPRSRSRTVERTGQSGKGPRLPDHHLVQSLQISAEKCGKQRHTKGFESFLRGRSSWKGDAIAPSRAVVRDSIKASNSFVLSSKRA